MSLRIRQNIAMLSLLLFVFAMGGRVAVAYVECPCMHHLEEFAAVDRHECCHCEDHATDCYNHTSQIAHRCPSNGEYDVELRAVVSGDSKCKDKFADVEMTLGCYVASHVSDAVQEVFVIPWDFALYDRYSGSIKLLRAPPVLS